MKPQLRALIAQGIDALRSAGTLPADTATPDFVVERPKTREHGDFSTNAAMLLAKHANQSGARSNPGALAGLVPKRNEPDRRVRARALRQDQHLAALGTGRGQADR